MEEEVFEKKREKEYIFKVLVIGGSGTGKTSIIKRYVHNFFVPEYKCTVGVDFSLKLLIWDEDTEIRLQLWDIAGQDCNENLTRSYYKGANAAFIVCDISRPQTLETAAKWKADLEKKVLLPNNENVPCILLANKWDLAFNEDFSASVTKKLAAFCRKHKFFDFFVTSARHNTNIDDAVRTLVQRVLENEINMEKTSDEALISLSKYCSSFQGTPKRKCFC